MQNILSNNISPYKLEESIEELRKHCKNKNKFKKDGSVLVGGTSRADYSGKVLKEHVQAEWFLISVFLKIQLLQDPFSTLAYLKNVA